MLCHCDCVEQQSGDANGLPAYTPCRVARLDKASKEFNGLAQRSEQQATAFEHKVPPAPISLVHLQQACVLFCGSRAVYEHSLPDMQTSCLMFTVLCLSQHLSEVTVAIPTAPVCEYNAQMQCKADEDGLTACLKDLFQNQFVHKQRLTKWHTSTMSCSRATTFVQPG